MLILGEPACCDLGRITGSPYPDAPHTYVDAFGFTYRLCAQHYHALVTGLQKAERFRPRDAARRIPWRPRFVGDTHPKRRPGDPTATGAEQRRARERVGWSLRRLQDELGYSRSHLQAAECGRRPVNAEVARWVRRVLDGPDGAPGGDTGDTVEDAGYGRAPSRQAGDAGHPQPDGP